MELRALISCLVVFGLGIPTQADAEKKDIIPGAKKFPGRFIGTPLVKKNGKEYVQFQDCSVIKNAKIREAECRTIVEVPSDILVSYIKCTRSDLEFERNAQGIASGAVFLASCFMAGTPAAPAALYVSTFAGLIGQEALKTDAVLEKFNIKMQQEKLTQNIDYETNETVDELVDRITALYTDISASGCFTGDKLNRVKASINLYGNRGPKKKVALGQQKFYRITGVREQASGSGNNKQTGRSLIKDSTQGEAR